MIYYHKWHLGKICRSLRGLKPAEMEEIFMGNLIQKKCWWTASMVGISRGTRLTIRYKYALKMDVCIQKNVGFTYLAINKLRFFHQPQIFNSGCVAIFSKHRGHPAMLDEHWEMWLNGLNGSVFHTTWNNSSCLVEGYGSKSGARFFSRQNHAR